MESENATVTFVCLCNIFLKTHIKTQTSKFIVKQASKG